MVRVGNINEKYIEYTIEHSVHQERASLCVSNPNDYPDYMLIVQSQNSG